MIEMKKISTIKGKFKSDLLSILLIASSFSVILKFRRLVWKLSWICFALQTSQFILIAFLEMLFTSSFNKEDLDYYKRRISRCLGLLRSLLQYERNFPNQAKVVEHYFCSDFLKPNRKFNLANDASFLSDLPIFTGF